MVNGFEWKIENAKSVRRAKGNWMPIMSFIVID